MPIITLEEFKTTKGITTDVYDAQLTAIISMVDSFIVNYCHREFGEGVFTEQNEGTIDYLGRYFIKMKNTPVGEVQSVDLRFFGVQQVLPLDVSRLDLFAKDGYAYYNYLFPQLDGLIRDEYRDRFYYTVTYSGGEDVPAAVKLAAVNMVWDMFMYLEETQVGVSGELSKDLSSVKIGDYTETYQNKLNSKFNKLHDAESGLIITPTTAALLKPFIYIDQSW